MTGYFKAGDKGTIIKIDGLDDNVPYKVSFDNGIEAWCTPERIKLDTEPAQQTDKYKLVITSDKSIEFERINSRQFEVYTHGDCVISSCNVPPVTEPEPPKPEPIMIGGVELKADSKFILKPFSEEYANNIPNCYWDRLRRKVITAKGEFVEARIFTDTGWWIDPAAIDRIIEVE
jgi:hypothetical protein